jgi:hypothetical protein
LATCGEWGGKTPRYTKTGKSKFMKLIKSLLVAAFALSLVVGTVVAEEKKEGKKQSCCEKAKAAGKDCSHKCCVEAKKEGKKCDKCNAKAEKSEKTEEKK